VRKKRKTIITVESERVVWFRKHRVKTTAWCPECGKQTRMFSTDEAALISQFSTRDICRFAEAGRIHFTETPEGLLLVCLKSLSDLRGTEGF